MYCITWCEIADIFFFDFKTDSIVIHSINQHLSIAEHWDQIRRGGLHSVPIRKQQILQRISKEFRESD